jgi:hypothetical protein
MSQEISRCLEPKYFSGEVPEICSPIYLGDLAEPEICAEEREIRMRLALAQSHVQILQLRPSSKG